jgi:hypothetical protein
MAGHRIAYPDSWPATGRDRPQTNVVDVYVGYLRRKLGEPTIATVRGAGYCLPTGSQPASPNGPDSHWQR